MALESTTVWEVRVGGAGTNGGGFNASRAGAGTDYSLQDAAQLSLTDLACTTGGTTLTSATGGFTAAMVGNVIHINSGTNFTAGFYEITAYTNTNTVTIDRDPTSGSNGSAGVGSVGGALDRADRVASVTPVVVAGNIVYVKYNATAYNATTTWWIGADGSSSGRIWIVGYDTNRTIANTDTNRPILTSSSTGSTTYVLVFNGAVSCTIRNFSVAATGSPRCLGIGTYGGGSYRCAFERIVVDGCLQGHKNGGTWGVGALVDVEVKNSTATTTNHALDASNSLCIGCYVHDNAGRGIYSVSGGQMIACISESNGEHGFYFNATSSDREILIGNCIFHNNASAGFYAPSTSGTNALKIWDCIFTSNGTFGIDCASSNNGFNVFLDFNAFYGNTSGPINNAVAGPHDVTLSANPFTDSAGGDFTLNSTAGAGAVLKSVATPLSIGGKNMNWNIGAWQTSASSSGGIIVNPGWSGGFNG